MTKEILENDTSVIDIAKYQKKYAVIFKNDDFTPMDFVMFIFQKYFNKSPEDSYTITMEIHNNGQGIAGFYTKEIAETKLDVSLQLAQKYGYPFFGYIKELSE